MKIASGLSFPATFLLCAGAQGVFAAVRVKASNDPQAAELRALWRALVAH